MWPVKEPEDHDLRSNDVSSQGQHSCHDSDASHSNGDFRAVPGDLERFPSANYDLLFKDNGRRSGFFLLECTSGRDAAKHFSVFRPGLAESVAGLKTVEQGALVPVLSQAGDWWEQTGSSNR